MASTGRRPSARLEAAILACSERGTRLTALRREVLTLILAAEGPITAYQLLDRLKETNRSAVPATIYRALDFLLRNGLIHKIESLSAFVPCTEASGHAHPAHFLICCRCGAALELEDPNVSRALSQAAAKRGFHATSAIVEVDGICASCAARAS
jgi:Fur family transcriptional regulator, zinc uptake regulator